MSDDAAESRTAPDPDSYPPPSPAVPELNPDVVGSGEPGEPPHDPERVLSLTEAAAYLQVPRLSLLSAIGGGRLKATRQGLGYRIVLADLLHFAGIAETGAPPPLADAVATVRNRAVEDLADAAATVEQPRTEAADGPFGHMRRLFGIDELEAAGNTTGRKDAEDEEEERIQAAPIVRMANMLLVQALEVGASDLYIQPEQGCVRIRARVDGRMEEMMRIPPHIKAPLLLRLMVMAEIAYGRNGWPQVNVIPIRHNGALYDLRVTCLRAIYGHTLAIRFPCRREALHLSGRGMPDEMPATLTRLISSFRGLVLLTGPAGAGKSETLFSLLNEVGGAGANICTLEDPVEYRIAGLQQIPLAPLPGRDLHSVLPQVLRQDPDIIAFGVIDDAQTALAAVETAAAGHLVVATIDAPDAVGAVGRLLRFGVDAATLSQALTGILAQRLLPVLCPACRKEETVRADELRPFGYAAEDPAETALVYRRGGCERCWKRGVRGRTGIFELLDVTPEIAGMIARQAPAGEIRDAALASGTADLRRAAGLKVREGIVSPADAEAAVRDLGPGRSEMEERMYRYRYHGT